MADGVKTEYDERPFYFCCGALAMADENFKESFNALQLIAFVVVFTVLLCLPPLVTWARILSH